MKKVLCVCGVGQGTSLLLKMNVADILQEKGIYADVDNCDLTSASGENADLIVTNSEFAKQINNDAPIVIVENYFDKNEIREKIEKYLNK
ncbi:MAG: PTS sugar transporter subunit IIB [Peptoniphilaceae bacterium]|nr:PTS sugar transporter subunit IIB [Peptoniphilaceae bacterium]MDY6018980.1 PTS sugar transporter subunit IIB [Anaerococcus sp.]